MGDNRAESPCGLRERLASVITEHLQLLPHLCTEEPHHHGLPGHAILQRAVQAGSPGPCRISGSREPTLPPLGLPLCLASSHRGDRDQGERTFADRIIKKEVMGQIEKLNHNKLLGPDGIHLRVVEERKSEIEATNKNI